jgi:putative transposase
MARLARIVIPALPHLVTQRGNGRDRTFFTDADYALYHDLLATLCRAAGVQIWSWVLMPSHVHLILTPADSDGIRRALAPVHRRYAGAIHARQGRKGHFWQGRFGAVALDEEHLAAAVRYVARNPVRAGLVKRAQDWPWSSARAHLEGRADGITTLSPVLRRFPRFAELVEAAPAPTLLKRLRRAESIGRPLGSEGFIRDLEARTGRPLRPGRRGPKSSRLSQSRLSGVPP